MSITPSSAAAGVGSAVKNVAFNTVTEVLQRKHLVVGSYDPTLTTIVDNVPVQIFSAAEAVAYGAGFQLHRMALKADKQRGNGVELWLMPVPEDGAATKASKTVTFAGTATETRNYNSYIDDESVVLSVVKGALHTEIADDYAALVNSLDHLPVTAVAAIGVVTLSAKSGGSQGTDITVTENWGGGEALPAGITTVIDNEAVDGSGDPGIDDALAGLGNADLANVQGFTDVNFGWGSTSSTVLDAISAYVGEGNLETGLYDDVVARPFRVLHGDVAKGTAGLTAALVLANARKLDRANGLLSAPGSPAHPVDLACQALGAMARTNNLRAQGSYTSTVLFGIHPGLLADQWTDTFSNRDIAVKDGVSTTMPVSGFLTLQNVLTFYHPDNVALANNGYRSMRNISLAQNMLASQKAVWDSEKWTEISIVEDVSLVTNATDKIKARGKSEVIDELVKLALAWESKSWIYSAAPTLAAISAGGLVVIRPAGNGFDTRLPVTLSGEAGIYDGLIEFDTALTVSN